MQFYGNKNALNMFVYFKILMIIWTLRDRDTIFIIIVRDYSRVDMIWSDIMYD